MNNMQSTGTWKCACGFENKVGARFCTSCGQPRPVPTASQPSDEWDCVCGFHNKRGKFCGSCGMARNANGSAPPQNTAVTQANSSSGSGISAKVGQSFSGGFAAIREGAKKTVAQGQEILGRANAGTQQTSGANSSDSDVPWETKPSGFQLNKRTIPVIVVAVILLVGAFWGYSVYRDKLYAAKCEELVTVMTETQETAKSLATLSADANVSQGELADRFAEQAERVSDLESSLSGKSGSATSKEQYERMMTMVAKDKEMLQKASEILRTAGKAENNDELEKLGKLHQEFEAARKEVQTALGEVKIPGQEAGQTISYQAMGDDMRAYVMKKLNRNEQYLAEKMQQYQNRLRADNEALKKKSEVVFLTEDVKKEGNDILIQGKFYNGTGDQVVGIGEMKIDATLNRFDDTVTAITEFSYEDPGIARIEIAPGGAAGAINLRLAGKAPKEEFNNFIVRVHKIHWRIRKAVKG